MSSLILCYNPLDDFERLSDGHFWPSVRTLVVQRSFPRPAQHLDSFRPKVDVKESKEPDTLTATFELPGLKPEDITIDLERNHLTVSGESTAPKVVEGDYPVRERRHGKFSRTLRLPFGTKPEDVKAKLENGLLTVTFPKSTPEQQPQRIAIQ